MQQDQIDAGKAIQRRTGKTFYLATKFLPERVRHATHVLYAFFRIADEVVDDPGDISPEQQRAELEALRAQALGETEPDDPVLEAFVELREQYGIADEEVNEFIDAMATDIETSRYETYADLEAYMRGSAAAVGVMMTAIMEPEMEDAALPHAIKLGEAFQLTNFLRDVREDILDRDRIYLPKRRSRDTTSARKKLNASSTLRSLERRWHTNSSALRTCTERALPVSAICPRTASCQCCCRPCSTLNITH